MRRLAPVLLIALAWMVALPAPARADPAPDAGRADLVEDYLAGRAAPADYPVIEQSCRTRAVSGEAAGQTCLGFMYAHGHGVAQDAGQAIDWWRKAALQGSLQAQNALGSTYEYGHGVPADCAEADRWYRMAADQGSPWGMYHLGVLAEEGRCRPLDDVQALAWFELALPRLPAQASQVIDSTLKLRALVAARMSPDQLAQARRVEQDFRPGPRAAASKVTVLDRFPTTNPSEVCPAVRDPAATYYPDRAQRLNVEGRARVACKVSAAGAPSVCTWTEEDPPGYGFGPAAARLGCLVKFDRPSSVPAADWVASSPIRFAIPPR
jgi:TPR repeat protein